MHRLGRRRQKDAASMDICREVNKTAGYRLTGKHACQLLQAELWARLRACLPNGNGGQSTVGRGC